MPDQLIKLPAVSTEVTISAEWFEERDKLVAEAKGITAIEAVEQFEAGGDALKRITKNSNVLEKMRKEFTAPLTAAAKMIKAASDKARKPLEQAKADLQSMLADFAEREARRAAAEAADAERLAREAAERDLAEAEAAAALFDEEAADLFDPEPAPIAPTRLTPKAEGVRVGKTVAFKVMDANAIPRVFLSVDESKIRAWCALHKDRILEATDAGRAALIPGVSIKVETKVHSR